MKGQNPFPTFLIVLLVVSWTGAQQLQRGFVAAQGRNGASASLHRERGAREGGGAVVGAAGRTQFRQTQGQQRSVQVLGQQGQQQVVQIPNLEQQQIINNQQRLVQTSVPQQQQFNNNQQRFVQTTVPQQQQFTNNQQRVVQTTVPQQQQFANNQQRVVQTTVPQQQQFTNNQQRVVQTTVPQQQQFNNNQQRVVQTTVPQQQQFNNNQQRVVQTSVPQQQRVVQIPAVQQQQQFNTNPQRVAQISSGQQQFNQGQQRVVQVSNPQPIVTNQNRGTQFPSSQQQQSFAPIENVRNTFNNQQDDSSFTQDAFPIQENAAIPQTVSIQMPLPLQRQKVRKQRVRVNSNKATTVSEPLTEDEEEEQRRENEEILHEQARNARYSFSSMVNDGLNDQMVSRQETREGLLTKGSYSYSDGFYQRTVHYEADENGYRVIGQEIKSIGDGPQPDPNGSAYVSNAFGNSRNEYNITAADLIPVEEESTNGDFQRVQNFPSSTFAR